MVSERAAWSADRLHPSELGHRLLAREFHAALAARGLAAGPAPAGVPDGPGASRAAAAWWLATRGTAWASRRCTDLLPGLVGLAAAETAHRLAGRAARVEQRAHRATAGALAEVLPHRFGQHRRGDSGRVQDRTGAVGPGNVRVAAAGELLEHAGGSG